MVPAQNPMDNPTYRVRYLGEVFVGSTGGVDKIEEGVSGDAYQMYRRNEIIRWGGDIDEKSMAVLLQSKLRIQFGHMRYRFEA